jgi:hypothetical protein
MVTRSTMYDSHNATGVSFIVLVGEVIYRCDDMALLSLLQMR